MYPADSGALHGPGDEDINIEILNILGLMAGLCEKEVRYQERHITSPARTVVKF